MNKGYFNYLSEQSLSSLFRNGKVLTRRDSNGSDSGSKGVNLQRYVKNIKNGRDRLGKSAISLDTNGFELLKSQLNGRDIDFFDNDQVINNYYFHCADTIKEFTGARYVYAFDHNIRSATGKKKKRMIKGGQQVQGPAHVVHGDYTLTSAPERIRQLSHPPGKNDTLNRALEKEQRLLSKELVKDLFSGERFAIINLWRNIAVDPVEINPIALCDASTVSTKDLVVFEIHYGDRVGENYFAKHNKKHAWYFYPKMVKKEALLIKQWDSKGGFSSTNGRSCDSDLASRPCTFSFHSAFDSPNTRENAPDRWSMEVRCIVVY